MNEKELQELYKSLSANPQFQLGTPEEFRAMLLDPQTREQFREAMNKQPGVQLGTKDEFEDYLGLKKKVSSPVSKPSSSIQPSVRTVGEGSNRLQLDWGTGEIKKVPVVSPDIIQQTTKQALEDTADVTVQDVRDKPLPSKGERALESLRKRRLGSMDYESPATKFTDAVEMAKDEPKSPAERSMPTFESITGKKNPFLPDQAGYKELSALTFAISNENAQINDAVDYLDAKLKQEAGFSMSDYYSEIGKFNAIQQAIEPEIQKSKLPEYEAKLNEIKSRLESPEFTKNEDFLNTYNSVIQEYNNLVEQNASPEQVSSLQARIKGLQERPEFKNIDVFVSKRQEIAKEYQSIANKYNSEANALNEKISAAQQQSEAIMQRIGEMEANPDLGEIKRLQGVYNINVEKFKAEIESGRYEYAQQFGEYLDWRQQQIDERYKNLSGFQKAMANTGRIALQSLIKIPRDIARLSDVVEKAVGLEGEQKGIVDKVQDFYIDLGNDMLNEFREPTRLQRGGFTDTAKWGDLQVDFSSDGDIISVRDKDGYVVPQMLSKEQEEEIKALPRENKFHASSFAYQTAQTITDVVVQILGAKGLSSLKVIPGIAVSRVGVGLTMNPLSTGASLVIVNAGMMADDLYKEGLKGGLSEEDAARYSLGTGVAVGMLNVLMGVGAEARFLKVGKIKLPEPNFGNGLKGAIGKRLFDFTKAGFGESFEEVVLERGIKALSQYAMNNLAGGDFDIGALARDTNELKSEFAISFITGGIVDLFRSKKEPSKVTTSALIDGSKDIPKTIAAVEAVAEAAGMPLSPKEVEEITSTLETTAKAVESAPEELKSNPEVISILSEKVKVDEEIAKLKEEIKNTDDAFNQEKKDQIAELEQKSAELSVRASEEAGVKPDEKAKKIVSETKDQNIGTLESEVPETPQNLEESGTGNASVTEGVAGEVATPEANSASADVEATAKALEGVAKNKKTAATETSTKLVGEEIVEDTGFNSETLGISKKISEGFSKAGEQSKIDKSPKALGEWLISNAQTGDKIIVDEDTYWVVERKTDKKGNTEIELQQYFRNENDVFENNPSAVKLFNSKHLGTETAKLATRDASDLFESSYRDNDGNVVVQQSKYIPASKDTKSISEAYHKAKAVEELLGKPTEPTKSGEKQAEPTPQQTESQQATEQNPQENATEERIMPEGNQQAGQVGASTEAGGRKVTSFGEYKVIEENGQKTVVDKDGNTVEGGQRTRILNQWAAANIDNLAMQGQEVDTSNVPDADAGKVILEQSTSPAQVAAAWRAEPKTTGVDESPSALIREAIKGKKFSPRSLSRRFNLSSSETSNLRRRYMKDHGEDASEVAEQLTEEFGFEVTEEDVFDAIYSNVHDGVPSSRSKPNPTKRALADKFKELTGGIKITPELADKLAERGPTLREDMATTERHDALLPESKSAPEPKSGDRVYKSLLERFMNDPTKSDADKKAVEEQGLTRERIPDEYMNELASHEFDALLEVFGIEQGLEEVVNFAFDLDKQFLEAQKPGTSPAEKQKALTFGSLSSRLLQKVAYEYTLRSQREKAAEIYEAISGLSIGKGQFIQSLSDIATPEAIANKTTAKIFKDQQEVLRKKFGARGKSLLEMIENLKEEVRATREEVRNALGNRNLFGERVAQPRREASNARQNTQPRRGTSNIREKRARIATERSQVIQSLKDKWRESQNLGIGFDPNEAARRQQELINDVARLVKTYVEEEITNIQELYDTVVTTLMDIGVTKDDAEALTREALLKESDIEFKDLPTGVQAKIEKQVEEVIDNFIDGKNEKDLWAELMDVGLDEAIARKIDKDVKLAIADVQIKKISQAIVKFKEEIKAAGVPVKNRKIKNAEEKIILAAKAGIIDNDALIDAFSQYFGYMSISKADLQEMARLGKLIFDSVSGETKAKLRRELDLFVDKIKLKNGISVSNVLAKEFTSLTIISALSTLGTTINVVVGSLAIAIPKIAILAAQNPLATVAAIKAFRSNKTNNINIGFRELINSFTENVAVIDLYGKNADEKFGRKASLVEDAMLVGVTRYYEKMTKGAANKKEAGIAALQLLGSVLMQPARLAFLLPGIDAAFSHPLSEFVRFVNAYNKLAKEGGVVNIKEKLGDAFVNKVSKYGKFDTETWENARLRAEQDMVEEKRLGIEHTPGFVERRTKEIVHQQVKEVEVDDALKFMKTGLLMGNPSGYLTGGLYNAYTDAMGIKEGDTGFVAWGKTFANLTIGMFLRVSMNGLNMVYNTMPGLIPTAINGILSGVETKETIWAKQVGEREAKKYPLERQLEAKGWVRKSDSEIWQDIGFQVASNFILMIVLSDMLDKDDEGKIILDPNRHFDISLGAWGNYIEGQEKIDMRPNTIKFRYDTSKDFDDQDGVGFSLALPLLGVLGIAGGLRDDLVYRPEIVQGRGWATQGLKSIYDVMMAASDISFSTIPRTFKDLTRISQRAASAARSGEDPLVEWGGGIGKIVMRPVKTAMQPSVYRDFYVSWQDFMDKPVKAPEGLFEDFAKDMILMDWMINGVKKDEYGNIIRQSSRFRGYAENILLNFVDIKEANDKIFEQPEYLLRKKHKSVLTSGAYLPPKNLLDYNKEKVSDDVKLVLANDFLDFNGRAWRDNYELLNEFKTDEYFKKAIDLLKTYAINQAKYKNNIIEEEPSSPEGFIEKLLDEENTTK